MQAVQANEREENQSFVQCPYVAHGCALIEKGWQPQEACQSCNMVRMVCPTISSSKSER